jgi:hypothetical protein
LSSLSFIYLQHGTLSRNPATTLQRRYDVQIRGFEMWGEGVINSREHLRMEKDH